MFHNVSMKKAKNLRFKAPPKLALTRLPDPLSYHIIVQPYEVDNRLGASGLILSDDIVSEFKKLHCIGRVVKLGPAVFNRVDLFGMEEDGRPKRPFEIGDVVYFGRHSGMWFNWNDAELVLLTDDRVIMKLTEDCLEDFSAVIGGDYAPYESGN